MLGGGLCRQADSSSDDASSVCSDDASPTARCEELPSSAYVFHIDVNNFYVAAEVLRNPALAGKALAISQVNFGGFCAVSAAAKAKGVRKGDGVGEEGRRRLAYFRDRPDAAPARVQERCPELIVLGMDMVYYRIVSRALERWLEEEGARRSLTVMRSSIDDFYVRVGRPGGLGSAGADGGEALSESVSVVTGKRRGRSAEHANRRFWALAAEAAAIKSSLEAHFPGITVAVGAGPNRLLARLATPCAKRGASQIAFVLPSEASSFACSRPVRQLPGFGGAVGQRFLARLGATEDTVLSDLRWTPKQELLTALGSAAKVSWLQRAMDGDDDTPVLRTPVPKSVSAELSFPPTATDAELRCRATRICEGLVRRLADHALEHGLDAIGGRLAIKGRWRYESTKSRTTRPPEQLRSCLQEAVERLPDPARALQAALAAGAAAGLHSDRGTVSEQIGAVAAADPLESLPPCVRSLPVVDATIQGLSALACETLREMFASESKGALLSLTRLAVIVYFPMHDAAQQPSKRLRRSAGVRKAKEEARK